MISWSLRDSRTNCEGSQRLVYFSRLCISISQMFYSNFLSVIKSIFERPEMSLASPQDSERDFNRKILELKVLEKALRRLVFVFGLHINISSRLVHVHKT